MEPIELTLAKKMYDGYCEAVGGLAFNGDKLPDSETFFSDISKSKQSNAWIVCAEIACKFFNHID